ncbi:MAG: Flp pilus assembly complex ATPase component TadA [Candidatus Riflebacteria bacterium]|nr:Flp pilus assembly complex ATPase component TadA [Candidatus Riflebacteria bacterium]
MTLLYGLISGIFVFIGILWTCYKPSEENPENASVESIEDKLDEFMLRRSILSNFCGMNPFRLRKRLAQAGYPRNKNFAEDYAGFQNICAAFFSAIMTTFAVAREMAIYQIVLAGLAGLIIGYNLNNLLLRRAISRRNALIQKQLPEVIDLIAIEIESGMRFENAICKVVEIMRGPISEEFEFALCQLRLGIDRYEAFMNVAHLIDNPDFTKLISTLIQEDQETSVRVNILRLQSRLLRGITSDPSEPKKNIPDVVAKDNPPQELSSKINQESSNDRTSRQTFKADDISSEVNSGKTDILEEKLFTKLLDDFPSKILYEQDQSKKRKMLRDKTQLVLKEEMKKMNLSLSDQESDDIVQGILDEMVGFGVIQKLLDDENISEIVANGPFQVYFARNSEYILSDIKYKDNSDMMRILDRIVSPLGVQLNRFIPYASAFLPDGSRVQIVIPPVCTNGTSFTILKPQKKLGVTTFPQPLTNNSVSDTENQKLLILENTHAKDLIDSGTLTKEMAIFLEACVSERLNIVVSGRSGAGKSTILSILANIIPDKERIIVCEHSQELELSRSHVLRLVTIAPNNEGKGGIAMPELWKTALNLRPMRIIVGECRGNEAFEIIQSTNNGQDGILTSCLAENPDDFFNRLETMFLRVDNKLPSDIIRNQIFDSFRLIIHVSHLNDDSRKVGIFAVSNSDSKNPGELIPIWTYSLSTDNGDENISGKYIFHGIPELIQSRIKKHSLTYPEKSE